MATFTGTAQADTLAGSIGDDTISGLAGSDLLQGLEGNDSISGGDGNDTIAGGPGNDTLSAGDGFDFIDYRNSAAPVTVNLLALTATGEGSDTLVSVEGVIGSALGDTLTGDGANNWFIANAGVDTIDGGGGNDAVDHVFATGPVTVNLFTGAITGPDGADVITSIEYAAGSPFDDALTGDAGDNLLRGRGGNDTLDGSGGFDIADYGSGLSSGVFVNLAAGTSSGGAGNDTLVSIEAVNGSPFADTLYGDASANRLTGGAAGDQLRGGAGNDTLDGGANTNGTDMDLADYGDATGPVVGFTDVGATPGSATGNGVGTDVLVGIEGFLGSDWADHFTGSDDDDYFEGRGGNDTFVGGAGFDYAGYRGGSNPIVVDMGLATGQVQDGWGGTDTLIGIEAVLGTNFNDTLIGGAGNDYFRGYVGNDSLVGGAGNDTIDYNNAGGAVTVNLATGTSLGADGVDVFSGFEFVQGGSFNDLLIAASTGSSLRGRAGNDTLLGEHGADTLRGDGGDDLLDGGYNPLWFQLDVANYQSATVIGGVGIQASLATGVVTGEGTDTLIDVEGVLGTSGADSLVGSDVYLEYFRGGAGNDTIDGGGGIDIADYQFASGSVTIDLSLAQDQATGADGTDQLSGIENPRGSNFDDLLVGDGANNLIRGNRGNDTIRGGDGTDGVDYLLATGAVVVDLAAGTATGADDNDTFESIENAVGSAHADALHGDAGDNVFRGMTGNDTIDGRGGRDVSSYSQALGAVTVDLRTGTSSGLDGVDTLISIEDLLGSSFGDTLIGDDGANRLRGDDSTFGASADDTLMGGGGNDTLEGAGGEDWLDGGAGNDTLDGGDGMDVVAYDVGLSSGVTVNLVTGTATGGAGADTLIGIERVLGSVFADVIVGDANDNALAGFIGSDTVTGGAGNDVFYLATAGDSTLAAMDRVTDYSAGDAIEFELDDPSVLSMSTLAYTYAGSVSATVAAIQADTTLTNRVVYFCDGVDGYLYVKDGLLQDGFNGTLVQFVGLTSAPTVLGVTMLATAGAQINGTAGGGPLAGGGGNDTISGLGGDDLISAGAGNDTINGGAGNDNVDGGAGNDTIDGGAGSDIARFSGDLSGYMVTRAGATTTVADGTAGRDGTDTTTAVEALEFDDFRVNLTVQAVAASVSEASFNRIQELYVAFFNRVPDADGVEYWTGLLRDGTSLNAIADAFYAAGVYFSQYTGYLPNMSHEDFVRKVYANVLGRTDPGIEDGVTYWAGLLANGTATRGSLVSVMLDSAHTFKGDPTWGHVADLLDNKLEMATKFVVEWGLNYNTGNDPVLQGQAITAGMAIAAAITPAGIDDAIALVGIDPSSIDL